MEESKVVYNGITQAGIDLERNDGELSLMHNCMKHGSSVKPIVLSSSNITLNNGERLLFIDDRGSINNYLVCTSSDEVTTLSFFTSVDLTRREIISFSYGEEVNKCVTLGNSLIILTSSGIHYFLYKDNSYTYLGDGLPELGLEFRLVGQLFGSDTISKVTMSKNSKNITSSSGTYNPISLEDDACLEVDGQLRGEINKIVSERYEAGQFVHPFLVRYALRTFTGDYAMQSPPILMFPNRNSFPLITAEVIHIDSNYCPDYVENVVLKGYGCELYFTSSELAEVADKWGDIITSIDIFVSEPMIVCSDAAVSKGYWRLYPKDAALKPNATIQCISGPLMLSGTSVSSIESGSYDCMEVLYDEYSDEHTLIPPADYPAYHEKIKNASVFYKVSSIPLNEYDEHYDENYNLYKVTIDSDVLSNLAVQPTLEDGYLQHERLCAKYSSIYNSRLNIANITRYPYGFKANELFPFRWTSTTSYNYAVTITVYIKDDSGGTCKVISEPSSRFKVMRYSESYVFYPNPKAYRMVISWDTRYADIPLSEHHFLNGAYYYGKIVDVEGIAPDTSGEDYIVTSNKVYTSEVNNPYIFPLSGINSIGDTTILGLAPITKALSEGQFGQFPMYAFTDEGVWAMEVNANTGLYSSIHPISRDACTNSDSITQLDDAVLFVTDKGLMLLSGSKVSCLSGVLDGSTLDASKVVMLDRIFEKEGLSDVISDMCSISDYLSGCKISYDYPNNRIIVFNPARSYAYIYSFDSGAWCTLSGTFTDNVVNYPKSYLIDSAHRVIDFSKKIDFDNSTDVDYLMLSRPLKFGSDELKSINRVINRGILRPTLQAMVLFASVDGYTYFPIGSVYGTKMTRIQGTAYKYFRIALLGTMNMREGLLASSFYLTRKWLNKGR